MEASLPLTANPVRVEASVWSPTLRHHREVCEAPRRLERETSILQRGSSVAKEHKVKGLGFRDAGSTWSLFLNKGPFLATSITHPPTVGGGGGGADHSKCFFCRGIILGSAS